MISDFNSMDGGSEEDAIKKEIIKKLKEAGISNIEFASISSKDYSDSDSQTLRDFGNALMELANVTQALSTDLIDSVSHMVILEKQLRMQESQCKIMLDLISMINDDLNYLKLPWYKKLFKKKNGK